MFAMKDFQYWPHMSTILTEGNHIKKFCQSVQEKRREGKGEEENYEDNCKSFCVTRKTQLTFFG